MDDPRIGAHRREFLGADAERVIVEEERRDRVIDIGQCQAAIVETGVEDVLITASTIFSLFAAR